MLLLNSIFRAGVTVLGCTQSCEDHNCYCGHNFLTYTRITVNFGFDFTFGRTRDCTILIEDSVFSALSSPAVIGFEYDTSNSMNDTSVQAHLSNVTIANNNNNSVNNPVIALIDVAILFVNCTFENNTGSVIQALSSKVIFQGDNVFRNNSALIGAGMQLVEDSYLYFWPHTHILFEDNHADYVGGAIYADNRLGGPCFFHVDSPTSNSTVVNFIGNAADFAGSSVLLRELYRVQPFL